MANLRQRRRGGFAALWPWPGNTFLALFAVWLFYMGSIATVDEVGTAFTGLGGVTLLTLLFGLRAAFAGRTSRAPRTGRRRVEPMRAASVATVEDAEVDLVDEADERRMVALEPQHRGDLGEAILELEAALGRERADRGAQVLKLEQALGALNQRVARPQPATDPVLVARLEGLEARVSGDRPEGAELAALAARLGALEARLPVDGADGRGVMTVAAFKRAIAERVVPRVQRMIADGLEQGSTNGEVLAARFAALEAVTGELRGGLGAIGRDLAEAEEGWRDALRKLDALTAKGAAEPHVPADVAALRDALTTIIEQNRDIRKQQAELSARFEPKAEVGEPR